MATASEYASLARGAYSNTSKVPDGWTRIDYLSNPDSGFQAAVYEKNGEIVISFAGTDWNERKDVETDNDIMGDGRQDLHYLRDQISDAQSLYQSIRENKPDAKITLAGHSLGGSEVQIIVAINSNDKNLSGITFGAMGVKHLAGDLGFDVNGEYNITNYTFPFDLGGTWGEHLGVTKQLLNPLSPLFAAVPGITLKICLMPIFLLATHMLDGYRLYFKLAGSIGEPISPKSPIILDIDGDGVETIGYREGASFDHDGNGFAEETGWASSDDGILSLDRNGDGLISNGKELFGDNTLLKNGQKASNGFAALAEFDDNQDGKIDLADEIWSQLKVWRDHDGDGYSMQGELYSLEELGIKSLNTQYADASNSDGKGNTEAWIGSYEKTDGTTLKMSDYLFQRDPAYTIAEEWLPVPVDIAALPNLKGYGNVYDLHQAIVRDTSGELKNLTEQFIALTDAEIFQQSEGLRVGSDTSKLTNTRMALLEQILFKWTGCDEIKPNSRGSWYDGRKLAVMEKFFGQDFAGLYGPNPAQNASTYLKVAYRGLCEMYYAQLMAQSHLKDIYSEINYSWDEGTQTLKGDLNAVTERIKTLLTSDPEAGKLILGEFTRSLRGMQLEELMGFSAFRQSFGYEDEEIGFIIDSAGKNLIAGTAGNDVTYNTIDDDAILGGAGDDRLSSGQGKDLLYGQAGDDQLVGGAGDVVLYGGDGNDYVQGGSGNDFLHGGVGDDFLRGCKGDDTYIYGRGFGNDTIYSMEAAYWGPSNQNGNDTVMFTGDLTTDSIDYLSDASFRDLVLRIKGTGETLRFTDWFWGIERQVEQFKFSDGSVLLAADVSRRGVTISGTEGNDSITTRSGDRVIMDGLGGNDSLAGADLNDVLLGGAGNDTLSGGAGNDILDGGAGDDVLYGWASDDTFIYGRGYGNDLIYDNASAGSGYDMVEFTPGLRADSFEYRSESNTANLILRIRDTGETLTFDKWFYGNAYTLEQLRFADGSELTASEIGEQGVTVTGTDKNDYVLGRNGYRWFIHPQEGNDSLTGADLNDVLDGGAGDDTLSGNVGNDLLDGGTGNDTLYNYGGGSDTYLFTRDHGQDKILDYDTTAGNMDTVKLGEGIDKQGLVMFRDSLDLLIFTDDDDYIRVSKQFQTNYGIERLEVTDGCYITRQDMENIVNVMVDFNNTQGMDIIQKYNTLKNDPIYQTTLAQTWHQQLNPQG